MPQTYTVTIRKNSFVEFLESNTDLRGRQTLLSPAEKIAELATKKFESDAKSYLSQKRKEQEAALGALMLRRENRGKSLEEIAVENGIDLQAYEDGDE